MSRYVPLSRWQDCLRHSSEENYGVASALFRPRNLTILATLITLIILIATLSLPLMMILLKL